MVNGDDGGDNAFPCMEIIEWPEGDAIDCISILPSLLVLSLLEVWLYTNGEVPLVTNGNDVGKVVVADVADVADNTDGDVENENNDVDTVVVVVVDDDDVDDDDVVDDPVIGGGGVRPVAIMGGEEDSERGRVDCPSVWRNNHEETSS